MSADTAPEMLFDGPGDAPPTLALAHGAGAPMDSAFMNAVARALAERGFRVARFEFPYMAARCNGGPRRPPDKEPVLLDTWRAVIRKLGPETLAIGGKSLGGRMASLVADEARVRGLVCLGYPFHPPGKPERLRIAHLRDIRTPTLILQGERDPFGHAGEVAGYGLPGSVRVHFLPDGDHGFRPRKRSGRTESDNLAEAVEALAGFLRAL